MLWRAVSLAWNNVKEIRAGTDKSLVRPGRKEVTGTKLGIYSTYSSRSSIHFSARCSNFCKPLKKNSEVCPSNQVSTAVMTSASEEKWRLFNFFFLSREQVVVQQGQIRRIGWVIKTVKAQVGQFLLGCKCPRSRVTVVQEQDHLGETPAAFFLQKVLQLHQQSWVILRVDSLALWKIINEENAVLIPKNWIEARTFPSDFYSRNFLVQGEPLCLHSIDCCFVSGS